MSLQAPFPYFGGKHRAAPLVWERFGDVANYVERCKGQPQSSGCRPVRFVALFVDQFFSFRARFNASVHLSWKAARCAARWSALFINSRFPRLSFSLFSSRWCTPKPQGIGPLSVSQTTCARSLHLFGSATLTHARLSLPRLCRVLIVTDPTGRRFDAGSPATNLPCAFFMGAF